MKATRTKASKATARKTTAPRLKAAAAGLACVLAIAGVSVDAMAVSNGFDFELPLGTDDTFLVSETGPGSVFSFNTYIYHYFSTNVLDGFVTVKWKDKAGKILLEGSYDPDAIFTTEPGSRLALTWGARVPPIGPTTRIAEGTADFSGTNTRVQGDCIGRLATCTPAQYLELAGVFPNSPAVDSAGNTPAPAPGTLIDSTEGRLEIRVYPGSPIESPDDFTSVTLMVFTTTVEQDAAGYLYTYAVTNETDDPLQFSWEIAGMSDEVDANSTMSRSFVSPFLPVRVSGVATTMLARGPAGGSFDLLTPVPEPSTWALLLGGVGLVAWRGRRTLVAPAQDRDTAWSMAG
jgi:hypothetical protein